MHIDARMAENVLTSLLKKGVPALPIHDSFVVANRHESRLSEAMEMAFHAA
jgi:hypothetical protein